MLRLNYHLLKYELKVSIRPENSRQRQYNPFHFEDEKHFYAIRKDGKITFRRPRFNGEVLVLSGENTSPTIYLDDYHNEIIVIGRVLEVRRDLSQEDEKNEQGH